MPQEAMATPQQPDPARHLRSMEYLVRVVQDLSHARTMEAITAIVREAARHLIGADGATFVLRDGDQCYYAEENAIAPLWKGKRFPMSACISGWVMLNARPAIIPDIYADPRIPTVAYKPTFVKSLAMVPIRRNAPIAAIGNYWASHHVTTDEELAVLQALADTTSVAIENAQLYGQLENQVNVLQNQQARIQEQHESLAVFTRALAHDLKEPVRSMKAFSRLAVDSRDDRDQLDRHLGFIRNAADRMGVLIDSVSQYIRLEDPEKTPIEPCPMPQILSAVRENLAELIRERSAIIESGPLPTIQATRSHVTQLVQNLIANAIRHNDGPVTVRIEAEALPESWRFIVRDNGRGIPAEHAKRIFEPFKRLTTSNECAGLGLAVCERILARYGGAIWCEPNSGQGAAFVFTLPRKKSLADTLLASDPPLAETPSNEQPLASLLVVDDRPDDLILSRLMLKKDAALKCRVLTAQGGEEALETLAREPVDLILLDINMPGVDGFEVLERIRRDAAHKNVAVIMCTGSDYDKDKERAAALGAVGYLIKPPTYQAFEPILQRVAAVRLSEENGDRTLRRAM